MARSKDPAVVRVAKRRYWREAEAEVAVGAWRRSGETLSGFARRYGIHRRRLGRWAASLEGAERREEAVVFHPVRLVGGAGSKAPIEIVTRAGNRVRVAAGFQADDLERVLSVLAVVEAGC
jgi:hypothetical protein